MTLIKGDIVLVNFPFTDLTQTKLRPAIVLWVDSRLDEITLCFISSQNVTNLSPAEFILNSSEPEFSETKLKVTSKVRVTRIITLKQTMIQRRLGKLGTNQIQKLNAAIAQAFQII